MFNVLSLFDGISCSKVALDRAGIEVNQYLASEIDPYAINISRQNYPDITQLGDIAKISTKDIKNVKTDINLIIAGFPCQDLSICKKDRSGLEGPKSSLFWEAIRILKEVKPQYFLFENVAFMPKADKDIISETLGVNPICIDSSLLSAQMRSRLYWANFPIVQPKDLSIKFQSILDNGYTDKEKAYALTASSYKYTFWVNYLQRK